MRSRRRRSRSSISSSLGLLARGAAGGSGTASTEEAARRCTIRKPTLHVLRRALQPRRASRACKRRSRPRSIAARAPAVRSSRKRRLCRLSRRSPRISFWLTRWRMYAREKRVQAGHAQSSSSGRGSRAKRAFLRFRRPLPGERRAGAPEPGRQHAVEHVDPALDHLEDALRVADAHEVARPLGRQQRRGPGRRRRTSRRSVLADRRARRARSRRSRAPQISAIERRAQLAVGAALGDPEDELAGRARRPRAGARPSASCARTASSSSRARHARRRAASRHIAMSEPSCAWIARGELRREARRRRRRRPSGT